MEWWGSLEMKVMGCWTSGSNASSELPQSEEPRWSALGWMLSIIFTYLERRFLVVNVNAKSISVVLRVKHCGSDDGRVA